ncbi:hypothetical protein DL93DRAFT_1573409 [Clavulina sp. PMI_390]|nr:hypothetical protein DL93DRAFT_1573409 [Clavulina sp. PMI_390]
MLVVFSDAKVRFGPVLTMIFLNLNLNRLMGSARFGSDSHGLGSGSVRSGSRFEPVQGIHTHSRPILLCVVILLRYCRHTKHG